ncbi:MAG TPA: TonB-dependent receptor [Rhodothermales bacterium]|nr:TonB-dependent receptor [Rhodothermales bacterium]
MSAISRVALLAVCVLALCSSTPVAFAQTATVRGRVLDDDNRPLPGASVQVRGTTMASAADASGVYEITGLPEGTYILVATYIGYHVQERPVTTSAGATLEINFVLSEDPLGLSEVVVSGTFNAATKLESSTAITTLSPLQIEQRIPRGTSDLLRAVPGIQVNTTYGEIGSDVTVRGLPMTANSSYRYVSLQEDGLPVFEPPGLLFAFPDAMLRVDETVSRMEAVRGGSAAVFASGTPGGIVNFISKTGGSRLGGTLKSTAGDQGMFRQDVNVGGPLASNWRFNVGGYLRYDRGVRYAGYPANKGGQLKANITRDFHRGYARLYLKYLNENNIWYMGIPIRNFNNPTAISGGPQLGTGTTYSDDRLQLTIPDAFNPGSTVQKDMRDGYVTRYRMAGLEISRDLGLGWNATLRARYLRSLNENNLMIDVADAFPITAFGAPGLPANVPRFIRYVNTGETITDQSAVADLNGNGLMSVFGMAFVHQPVSNFISNLQVTKRLGRHSLNTGLYVSGYETNLQLVQAGVFVEVKNQPRLVQVMIPGPEGQPMGLTPTDGFAGYNTGFYNLHNTTQVGAVYAGDTWQITDRLNLDFGGRLDVSFNDGASERPVAPGRVVDGVVVGQEVPEGYAPFTPTPQQSVSGMFGSGVYRNWDYTFSTWGASLGVNYRLTNSLAIYARGSRGARIPTVQQWTFQTSNGSQVTGETNKGEVETILQAEVGLKAARPQWSALVTGFYGSSKNLITVLHRGRADGSFAFLPIPGDTRTIGVEAEVAYSPIRNLNLQVVSTLQDPRFTRFEYEFFVPGDNPLSGPQVRDYEGNFLNDAVRILADFTASYTVHGLDAFANYRYTGERMANRPNTIVIPGYGELQAGIGYTYRDVRLAVRGTNLTNTQAIALMASRTGEDVLRVNADGAAESIVTTGPNAGTTTNSTYTTGQAILPRSILVSVGYRF